VYHVRTTEGLIMKRDEIDWELDVTLLHTTSDDQWHICVTGRSSRRGFTLPITKDAALNATGSGLVNVEERVEF
jgi:hypothetical protein